MRERLRKGSTGSSDKDPDLLTIYTIIGVEHRTIITDQNNKIKAKIKALNKIKERIQASVERYAFREAQDAAKKAFLEQKDTEKAPFHGLEVEEGEYTVRQLMRGLKSIFAPSDMVAINDAKRAYSKLINNASRANTKIDNWYRERAYP